MEFAIASPAFSSLELKVWKQLTIVVVFVLHGDIVAPRVSPTFPRFVIDLILTVWKEMQRENWGSFKKYTF